MSLSKRWHYLWRVAIELSGGLLNQIQMILLTANRRMKGKDSLEQVLREENTPTSLPVITIGMIPYR